MKRVYGNCILCTKKVKNGKHETNEGFYCSEKCRKIDNQNMPTWDEVQHIKHQIIPLLNPRPKQLKDLV